MDSFLAAGREGLGAEPTSRERYVGQEKLKERVEVKMREALGPAPPSQGLRRVKDNAPYQRKGKADYPSPRRSPDLRESGRSLG